MTIKETMENLVKIQKRYQMNDESERETIWCAVGYLENLKVFAEKIDGISENWKERAMNS